MRHYQLQQHEVKLRVDQKQTRIDATFREQRDIIIANKDLRNAVKQWSNVSSMEELVAKIKAYGKNDLENAWLLFCWIDENIRCISNCKNNAAENVFRDFASLYHECCSLFSIVCPEISRYAKQAFLKSGQNLKDLLIFSIQHEALVVVRMN